MNNHRCLYAPRHRWTRADSHVPNSQAQRCDRCGYYRFRVLRPVAGQVASWPDRWQYLSPVDPAVG